MGARNNTGPGRGSTGVGDAQVDLGAGARLLLTADTIRVTLPRLLKCPLSLRPDELAACHLDEITEDRFSNDWDAGRAPRIVELYRHKHEPNLLLLLAQEQQIPPIRLLARLGPRGMSFHSTRKRRSADGLLFSCPDPDRAVDALELRGVVRTTTPRAWSDEQRRDHRVA